MKKISAKQKSKNYLGFVLMAVQESEFLPPPTQLDILYGFTDLIIVGTKGYKGFHLEGDKAMLQ